MSLSQPLSMELQQESATTRRLFERLPESSLLWQPHIKSMSMGRLAAHIVQLIQLLNAVLLQDDYDVASTEKTAEPENVAAILRLFDQSLAAAAENLKKQSDERLSATWRFRMGEQVIFELPRTLAIRSVILNHLIHHRGQLSVYLRLQNVPLPSIYGPTADETV